MNSDLKELLRIFNDHGVKYLVVGGYAVMYYTEPRYTKDLDIWVRADIANATRVFAALKEFGAPLVDLTPDDFAGDNGVYMMGRPPLRADVMMAIDGIGFDEAWPTRQIVDIDGTPVSLIGIEALMRNKEATGRPQDLIDLENLHACLRE